MSKFKKFTATMLVAGAIVVMVPTAAMAYSSGTIPGGSCGPDDTNVISSSVNQSGTVRHDWQFPGGSSSKTWPSGTVHSNETSKRSLDFYSVQSFGSINWHSRTCS